MPSFEKSVHKTYGVLAPWFSMYSGSSSWFVAELVVENILVKASFMSILSKVSRLKALLRFFNIQARVFTNDTCGNELAAKNFALTKAKTAALLKNT